MADALLLMVNSSGSAKRRWWHANRCGGGERVEMREDKRRKERGVTGKEENVNDGRDMKKVVVIL